MPYLRNLLPALGQWRRFWIISGLIVGTLLGLGGCTALRLSYNNAETLAFWWMDDYFDFDKIQSERVRSDLAEMARWHRREELPLLAELLDSAQAMAQKQPDGNQICAVYERGLLRMQALAEHALPAMAAVAPTLRPSQLKNLAANYDKSNRKWREEWINTETDTLDKRTQKVRERLEDFYGALNPAQLRQLQQRMAASGLDDPLLYRERVRRQQEALRTLDSLRGDSAASANAALGKHMKEYFQSSDPAYRAYRDRSVAQTCETIAQLHAIATPQQRNNLVRKLQAYAQDVQILAGSSP
jgi:hypothetical protein